MRILVAVGCAGFALAALLALGGPFLRFAGARLRRAYGTLTAGLLMAAAVTAAWVLVPRRATTGTTLLILAVALPALVAASIALAIRRERERGDDAWVSPAVLAGFPALVASAATIAFVAMEAANERSQ